MSAGIAMKDIVSACSVGIVKEDLFLDLTLLEQNNSTAFMPIVIKSQSQEVIYAQLDSRIKLQQLEKIMNKALEGCSSIKLYLESAIKEYMSSFS